ncbi:MAG TPA: CDP-alcohol phosphatidyltransferase family protein [Patescibacteria group bacterium]|jgi:phosphatidylglycerophosphate synthase
MEQAILRINPNVVSLTGVALCAVAGVIALLTEAWLMVAVVFAAGVLCDLLDGKLARRNPDVTRRKVGAVVDALCDKLGEAAFVFPLILATPPDFYLLGIAYGLGLWSSEVKMEYSGGNLPSGFDIPWREVKVFGRGSRTVTLVATLLVAGLYGEHWFVVGFWVLLVTNGISVVWRNSKVWRHLRKADI